MSSDRDALEKILGGAIEQRGQRAVPGLSPVEGVEFVYYEDDGKSKAKKQFNALLDAAVVIRATSGGGGRQLQYSPAGRPSVPCTLLPW